PSKRKTTRGAHDCTSPVTTIASRTEKARNLTVSQRLTPGTLPSPPPTAFSCCRPDMGRNRGDSRGYPRRIPTLLCVRLLQFNLGASLFELSLELVGLFLVHAFLDRLGRAFDEVLGFLEAQAGDGADFLDDFDLLVAGGSEHDRELGLFFSRSGSGGSGTGDRNGGSSGHAPLFFQELCKLGSFEHGEAREVVDDFL